MGRFLLYLEAELRDLEDRVGVVEKKGFVGASGCYLVQLDG